MGFLCRRTTSMEQAADTTEALRSTTTFHRLIVLWCVFFNFTIITTTRSFTSTFTFVPFSYALVCTVKFKILKLKFDFEK